MPAELIPFHCKLRCPAGSLAFNNELGLVEIEGVAGELRRIVWWPDSAEQPLHLTLHIDKLTPANPALDLELPRRADVIEFPRIHP